MSSTTPVPALPSATVVLLRQQPTPRPPEVLMVLRHPKAAFGNRYAFPGGLLDPQDRSIDEHCAGVSAAGAVSLLDTEHGLAYFSAAVRELYEEVGVLLARDQAGEWARLTDASREALLAGELSWPDMLSANGLRIACDALHYFAFWETPLTMPKRFSARFFVAVLPEGQHAVHDGRELTDSTWMSAGDAVGAAREGGLKLPFPTTRTLESIAGMRAIDEVLAWAEQERRTGIEHRRPEMIDGELRVVVL